jgi:hypothetical protein
MKSDPTDASAPFNLGNMLRAAARTVEAEAALRGATRANPTSPTCWMITGVPKPLSNVCAKPSLLRRITLMRCSIWRCCCSGRARMSKRPTIGGSIW